MIYFKDLELGTKLFKVSVKNNLAARKRISTVIDGVEWFRYDREILEYSIVEVSYCGRVEYNIYGEIGNEACEYDIEYHVKFPNGSIYEYTQNYNECENFKDWFLTFEEAEVHMKNLQEKNKD